MPEFDLIDKFLKPLANNKQALGLVDDAALIAPSEGCTLVISKDMMVEGVHYHAGTSSELLAKKLLRVNLSDMAAMGAKPLGYLLGLSLPKSFSNQQAEKWLTDFVKGLKADQEQFNVKLLGGDTVSVDAGVVLSLTIIGEVKLGQEVRRSTAKVGDVVMVSGCLGDAALALNLDKQNWGLDKAQEQYLLRRLQLPSPRVEVGELLGGLANSAVDLSDGLLADISHIATSSAVSIEVHLEKLPLSDTAKNCLKLTASPTEHFWPFIYGGGDDYELAITIASQHVPTLKAHCKTLGIQLSEIGEVKAGSGVKLLDADQNEINPQKCGYEHFNG